jgi:diguanylate cyclase (GGDEF)-like protein
VMRSVPAAALAQRDSVLRLSLLALGICVAYLALGPISRATVFPDAGVSLVWLPTALGMAAIARSRRQQLPYVIGGLLAGEIIADSLVFGFPAISIPVFVAANITEQLLGGLLLRRLGAYRLARPRDVVVLVATAILASAVGASIGAWASSLAFDGTYAAAWRAWFFGAFTAVTVVGPFFLLVRRPLVSLAAISVDRRQLLLFVGFACGTLLAAAAILTTADSVAEAAPLVALLTPLLGWIGIRFGVLAVSMVSSVVVYACGVAAARSIGPFVGDEPDTVALIRAQIVLVLISATMYAAAAVEQQRRQATQATQYLAYHDSLTGLPNRYSLLRRLDAVLDQRIGKANDPEIALIFCDLDGFKTFNDSLGHAAGDELLKQLATRLSEIVGDASFLARYGGDEFVVVCTRAADLKAGMDEAARIQEATGMLWSINGREQRLGMSMGVAHSSQASGTQELLRNADLALYEAKRSGMQQMTGYRSELEVRLRRGVDDEDLLRAALGEGRVEAWLQPVVRGSDRVIVGFEALARLRTRDGELVLPNRFIDAAERSGLVIELGRRVLDKATAWLAGVASTGAIPIYVAINVSVHELNDPGYAGHIAEVLAARKISPDRLVLEVTERVLLNGQQPVLDNIRRLFEAGVRIAIDDFGTGYSSLTLLRSIPVSIIKADRSFVSGIASDADDKTIVSAIVNLAHDLRLTTVAEGVETPEQETILQAMGYDYLQGYFYSRVLPADSIDSQIGIDQLQAQLHSQRLGAQGIAAPNS